MCVSLQAVKSERKCNQYIRAYRTQAIIIPILYFTFAAGPYIGYMSDISQSGSGGSPILKEYSNELIVVGLHLGNMTIGGSIYIAQNGTLITVITNHIRGEEYDESRCKHHCPPGCNCSPYNEDMFSLAN